MPYIITEGRRPNTYMVINDITGKVHSFGSTLENAKKQLGVLRHLEGLEHIEGSGIIYNEKTKKVSIPSTNQIQFIVPPFLVRERGGKNKYRLKLVNPLTKQRNISSREKEDNIRIFRKLTPTADLHFRMTDYDLREFSPKDRATILEYDALISNEWGDRPKDIPVRNGFNKVEYDEVPDVKFYNQPRGFPVELPANEGKPKRKNYKDIMAYLEGQDVDFNQMRPPPKRRNKSLLKKEKLEREEEPIEEPMEQVAKRPRGRPRTRPIIAPEDKKPRGRPRTRPIIAPEDKKPRGRPSSIGKKVEVPIDIKSLRKMTDKKLQKEVDSRKTALDWTIKKLNENEDPTKVQDIEKDIDLFRVRYLNALNELQEREPIKAISPKNKDDEYEVDFNDKKVATPKKPKTPKIATPKKVETPKIATPKKVETPKYEEDYEENSTNTDYSDDEIESPKKASPKKAYPKKDVDKATKLYNQLNKIADDPKKEKVKEKLYEKLEEIEDYDEIIAYLDEGEEVPIQKKKTGGKISSNSIMPNRWIEYVKDYASKNGIRYGDALKDPQCKAGYKKGGMVKEDSDSDSDSDSDEGIHIDIGSHNIRPKRRRRKNVSNGTRLPDDLEGGMLFRAEPGRITHQAGTRGIVVGSKNGFGLIDEGADYGLIAKSKNSKGLGANAGRKFISL